LRITQLHEIKYDGFRTEYLMKTIAKASIVVGFFCWAVFASRPSMAQGPYCYFDPKYNALVCIPDHRFYAPKRYFPFYGPAYFGDPTCYPQYGMCCPAGFILRFILQKRVCVAIGW
jgi:hypothetical protein